VVVRRVVTGHDHGGKSVFVSDEQVAPLTVALVPGFECYPLWGGDEAPRFPDTGAIPRHTTYFPPIGGFRFEILTIPPAGAEPPHDLDVSAAQAELEEKFPGLSRYMEPDGMHASPTVDFEIVLFGEVTLELDDGATVRLRHCRAERHSAPVVKQRHGTCDDGCLPVRGASLEVLMDPRAGRKDIRNIPFVFAAPGRSHSGAAGRWGYFDDERRQPASTRRSGPPTQSGCATRPSVPWSMRGTATGPYSVPRASRNCASACARSKCRRSSVSHPRLRPKQPHTRRP